MSIPSFSSMFESGAIIGRSAITNTYSMVTAKVKKNKADHCVTPDTLYPLQWRHNERHVFSNHQPHDCLLNILFRRRSNKTPKLSVTGLCFGNSPVTAEFPAQRASNAESISIWWRHHAQRGFCYEYFIKKKWLRYRGTGFYQCVYYHINSWTNMSEFRHIFLNYLFTDTRWYAMNIRGNHLFRLCFNPLRSGGAFVRQWTGSALIQVMALCHMSDKLLPEPVMTWYQLDT